MSVSPYFSVITPAYNRASFLPNTIRSVQKQTYSNWEYIIIDDASKDDTKEVIESFKDERIIYLRNEKNMERGASRNRGIEIARGKYICFLDSDDEFLDNHLAILFEAIQTKQEPVALLFTKSMQRVNNGDIHEREYVSFDEKNKLAYILHNTFNPTSVAIHTSILDELKYDASIPGLEDLDLWLHIALKYPVYQINEFTNLLNFHEGSYTEGDYERFTKELRNFQYIFNKSEFRRTLPNNKKNRLLGMCYYRLAIRYENEKNYKKMYASIFKAFYYYSQGYNSNSNKTMAVMFVYHFPLIGNILRYFRRQ